MVTCALCTIGVNPSSFTGDSCRQGGLTIASEASVPESIMWMQRGHAQSMAARRYVRLTDPDREDFWTWPSSQVPGLCLSTLPKAGLDARPPGTGGASQHTALARKLIAFLRVEKNLRYFL